MTSEGGITCEIPITLRISGRLDDDVLSALEERLVTTLRRRMREAVSLAEANDPTIVTAPTVALEEAYDPDRHHPGADTYSVRSYRGGGRPVSMRLTRRRRRWYVPRGQVFTAYVKLSELFDLLETSSAIDESDTGIVAVARALYADRLSEIVPISVLFVVTRSPIAFNELANEVNEHYARFVPADRTSIFFATVFEATRQQLVEMDTTRRLRRLRSLEGNRIDRRRDGIRLRRRAGLVFVRLTLKPVTLEGAVVLYDDVTMRSTLADLRFLISDAWFEASYGLALDDYIAEADDLSATLKMTPFATIRDVHKDTLDYLFRTEALHALAEGERYAGAVRLLSDPTLAWLPSRARAAVAGKTDAVTRAVPEARTEGLWERDWAGVHVRTVLAITDEAIERARLKPTARELADDVIRRFLRSRGRPRFPIEFEFERFLNDTPTGIGFELFLDELERRGYFERLLEFAEETEHAALFIVLMRRALGTKYADDPRILAAVAGLNRRRRESFIHGYVATPGAQEIWLEKRSDARVIVGARDDNDIVGEVWGRYTMEEETQRIRPSKMPEFQQVLETESRALMEEILTGAETREFTEESFAEEAFTRAARSIGLDRLQDEFIEDVTKETSVRLVAVTRRPGAIEEIDVTFETVQRYDGGPWEPVPGAGRATMTNTGLEERLAWGPRLKGFAFVQTMSKVVAFATVFVIAWEVGIVGALVEAAGGTVVVAVSIGISELIYLVTAETYTLEGFALAALDGYLMALGFRGAGFVGRSLATRIGTGSMRTFWAGWIAERLTVGSLGGASSAAMIRFSHDIVNIALGRAGFSSVSDYVSDMKHGAFFGILGEFAAAPLQAVFRVGGRTALDTLAQVTGVIRDAGLSPARWAALSAEALGNMATRLRGLLPSQIAEDLVRAFRERLATVTETLGASGRRSILRGFTARRVLELGEIGLTREATEGLEKLIGSTLRTLDEAEALALFNHVKARARTAGAFLEALPVLDDAVLDQLATTGTVARLVDSPALVATVGLDPVVSDMISATTSLSPTAASSRVDRILDVASDLPTVPQTVAEGAHFASGGTSSLFEAVGRPDLLVKRGGGRLPVEARSLIEAEMLGIPTVYAATRQAASGGGRRIIVQRIDGVGSKDIIGRLSSPFRPPRHTAVISQRTIDDLERIYSILKANRANLGDFQFIVRRSDGAVFLNDPTSFHFGRGPSGSVRSIIDRFAAIYRRRTGGGGGP